MTLKSVLFQSKYVFLVCSLFRPPRLRWHRSNKRCTCFVSYSKMGVDIKGCASKFTVGCSSTSGLWLGVCRFIFGLVYQGDACYGTEPSSSV